MYDTLLYFLSLFLNISLNILYFFNRQMMVCYIPILFLTCCRLFSFSSCDSSILSSFYLVMRIADRKNPSLLLNIQGQTHLQLVWELQDDSLYRCHSHASSSFLISCFVNDKTLAAGHQLRLYNMSSLLAWIVCITSSLIYRSWNLLFCTIDKRDKPWKVMFNFINCSEPFYNVVYLLRDSYAFSNQPFSLLNISTNVALIQIKEKAS